MEFKKYEKPSCNNHLDISETADIARRVSIELSGGFYGFPAFDHTFIGSSSNQEYLGKHSVYNSPLAAQQLAVCLTLFCSDHPLIRHIQNFKSIDPSNKDTISKPLESEQVLDGKKILDLGCGFHPSFARTARKLGANVFTIDVIPASEFLETDPNFFPPKLRQQEINNHITLNLNDFDAIEKILEITGGEFDLVTSAHLDLGGMYRGEHYRGPRNMELFSAPLLNESGIYINGDLIRY